MMIYHNVAQSSLIFTDKEVQLQFTACIIFIHNWVTIHIYINVDVSLYSLQLSCSNTTNTTGQV